MDIDWTYGMTENEVCVAPGDIVNFIWTTNHNVVPVSAEDYLACRTADTEPVEGPMSWETNYLGTYYLISGVGTDCAEGNMKVTIGVSSGSCRNISSPIN